VCRPEVVPVCLAGVGRLSCCSQGAGCHQTCWSCLPCFYCRGAGRYGLLGAARCLLTSYSANLLGSLLLIALMLGGDVFKGREDFVVE
jgi:hypothetical protein